MGSPQITCSCPQCQRQLAVEAALAGHTVECPACRQNIWVPSQAPGASSCAICQCPILENEPNQTCPDCHAVYHAECWQHNEGCAVYGCAQVPPTQQRQALEIPGSYWGQENKPCPACGKQILAAALRCRYCGAVFESARPQDAQAFRQRSELEQRLPRARRTIIWVFVFCVLPCTAPVGALAGGVWFGQHRLEIKALPALYGALCKIALAVGAGQTAAFVILGLLYAAFGT